MLFLARLRMPTSKQSWVSRMKSKSTKERALWERLPLDWDKRTGYADINAETKETRSYISFLDYPEGFCCFLDYPEAFCCHRRQNVFNSTFKFSFLPDRLPRLLQFLYYGFLFESPSSSSDFSWALRLLLILVFISTRLFIFIFSFILVCSSLSWSSWETKRHKRCLYKIHSILQIEILRWEKPHPLDFSVCCSHSISWLFNYFSSIWLRWDQQVLLLREEGCPFVVIIPGIQVLIIVSHLRLLTSLLDLVFRTSSRSQHGTSPSFFACKYLYSSLSCLWNIKPVYLLVSFFIRASLLNAVYWNSQFPLHLDLRKQRRDEIEQNMLFYIYLTFILNLLVASAKSCRKQ